MIVTGEASGDLHGANLARSLKALNPEVRLIGVGGQHMKAAGVQLVEGLHRLDSVGVPGFLTIWKGISNILTLKRFFKQESLHGVVFVDNPSMNLRLARIAAKLGHRVVYYIAPQIWAWGRYRINLIKRVVRRMIVVLPFEEPIYRKANVPCNFVGHPLLDSMSSHYNKAEIRKQFGLSEDMLILGIFPGSRFSEVQLLLPPMMEAVSLIKRDYPDIHCIIGQAPTVSKEWIDKVIDPGKYSVTLIPQKQNEVMAAADLLLVASGTATLQAALIGTPMVLTYRVSWLTYLITKFVATIKYIGLVNLVAERGIVPELLQTESTAERLSEEALRLLKNPNQYHEMKAAFQVVRERMGTPGASDRAAEVVLAECQA